MASVVLIWVLSSEVVHQAVLRLLHPQDVRPDIMLGAACVGFCCNMLCACILMRQETKGINLRSGQRLPAACAVARWRGGGCES